MSGNINLIVYYIDYQFNAIGNFNFQLNNQKELNRI